MVNIPSFKPSLTGNAAEVGTLILNDEPHLYVQHSRLLVTNYRANSG